MLAGRVRGKTSRKEQPAGKWVAALRLEYERLRRLPLPDDPAGARREVEERRCTLSTLAAGLEATCRQALGLSPKHRVWPYFRTACFTAHGCLASPTEEALRQWFRVLAEQAEVESAVAGAEVEGAIGEDATWGALRDVRKIGVRFAVAEFVWHEHCRRFSEAGTEAAEAVLAEWVAFKLGTRYLLPMLQRVIPGADEAQLRHEVAAETRARTTRGRVLELIVREQGHPERPPEILRAERTGAGPWTDIAMADIPKVPAAVATRLRRTLTDAHEIVGRLPPAAIARLDAANAAAPDPLATVLVDAGVASIYGQIARLAPRRREAFGLLLEGCTYAEIASRMGIGLESVKSHPSLARSDLRAVGAERILEG